MRLCAASASTRQLARLLGARERMGDTIAAVIERIAVKLHDANVHACSSHGFGDARAHETAPDYAHSFDLHGTSLS